MTSKTSPAMKIVSATAVPFLALLPAALLLVAPVLSAQEEEEDEEAEAGTDQYRVQPGDLLHISVWNEEGLDQEVLVRPDGGVSFPLAGDINARGSTVEDLRQEITERLERYIPGLVVTVSVREINGNKIYVVGQVNEPGEFVMNPRIDVMQALSVAGGTTEFASTNGIFILRREDGRQVAMQFRMDDVVRGRDLEQNVMLESGDVVVVP